MKLWNRIRWKMAGLWADESGMGVVEVILIIVVLIAAIAVYYEGRIIHILKQNNKR